MSRPIEEVIVLGPLPTAHRAGLAVIALLAGALLGLSLALAAAAMGTLAVLSPGMAALVGGCGTTVLALVVLVGRPSPQQG